MPVLGRKPVLYVVTLNVLGLIVICYKYSQTTAIVSAQLRASLVDGETVNVTYYSTRIQSSRGAHVAPSVTQTTIRVPSKRFVTSSNDKPNVTQTTNRVPRRRFVTSSNDKPNVTQTTILVSSTRFVPNTKYKQTCTATFKENHLMTIDRQPLGRTGNNMFRLLALLATANDNCYTPVLTNTFAKRLDDVFGLDFIKRYPNDVAKNNVHEWRTFKHQYYAKYDSKIEQLDMSFNWNLNGYFQSWRFFNHQKDYIKSKLTFRSHLLKEADDFLANITDVKHNRIYVCVHVRRGDMLRGDNSGSGYAVAGVDYLNQAMKYFINNITGSNTTFIYLSDDIGWCQHIFKQNNGSNIYFSPFGSNFAKDLALMSVCNHTVITSGTFGWIGAWFSGGSVVYFKGFPRPGSGIDMGMNRTEYYPKEWIGMT